MSARRGLDCAARTVHSELRPDNNDCSRIRALATATATEFCVDHGGLTILSATIFAMPAQSPAVVPARHGWLASRRASRSWVHARLFLQNCDSRQRVAPVPRLAHASRSWVHASLFLQNCDARQRVASRTTAGLRQPLLGQRPVPVIDDYSPAIVRLAHAVD
jgi:hypothetical protein